MQNEAPDLTPSESYQSSDEDSDAEFALENASMIDHSAMLKMVVMSQMSHIDTASSPVSSQIPLIEHLEITVNNNIKKVQSIL